jgi:purine-binding chemotaxis protein CheW
MSSDTESFLPKAASTEPVPSNQYLTFALAGELFAIPILAVQEIRCWETVSRTPRAPEHVLGVMNLRGAVIPIVDLRVRLGLPASERSATSVVIVVRVETRAAIGVTMGCLVDAVSDVVSLAVAAERPTPSACGSVDSHFLAGMATGDSQLIMLLDLVRLVETSIGDGMSSFAA